jgi:hypothetical protein
MCTIAQAQTDAGISPKCFMCKRYTESKCNKLGYKVNPNTDADFCSFFDIRTKYQDIEETQEEILREAAHSGFGYSPLEDILKDLDEMETY